MFGQLARQKRTLFITVVFLLLCAGVVFFHFDTRLKTPDLTKVYRIGVNQNVKAAPVLIADNQDYFRKAGVNVSVIQEKIAVNLLNGLFEKKYDFVCVPSFLVAQAYIFEKPVKILAVLNRNQGRHLVMNPDFVENPADLAGKTVGINPHTAAEHILSQFLILNGVDENLVTVNSFADDALPDVLASGQVAAILTWPPNIAIATKKMNGRVLVINAQMGEDMYWLLVSRTDTAEQENEAIDALFKALDRSYTLIFKNQKKAQEIVSKELYAPLENIEEEWRDFVFLLELPQSLLLIMEQQSQWISKKTGIPFDIRNLFSLYDYHHLDRVYPERVTMIR